MTRFVSSFAHCAACGFAIAVLALAGCHEKTASTKPSTQPQGASEEHFGEEAQVKPVAFIPAATPASKPTQTLDKTATCVTSECHATLITSKHIHGPVSEKSCYSCHNEDLGGHKFPLKRTGNETCTFCHAVSGTMSHQHKALDQGCTSCHRPHESNTKFLLKADTVERLCASCHNVPLKKHAHEPFAKGDCTSCHLSHQATNKMLLRGGEGSQHCFTCHKNVQQKLATVSNVHKPARTDCVSCHSPHSTDFEHQLKTAQADNCFSCHRGMKSVIKQMPVKHGALTTADGCSNCHDPHGSNEKKLLIAPTDTTCLKCHDKQMTTPDGRTIANMKPVLTASKFLHGPNKAGNCSGCHDPHGSKEPQLLERSFPKTFYTSFAIEKYDLCFTCHEKALVLNEKTTALTGFRDGDANLHFIHVNRDQKGRSCKSCHNVHGSDLPNHLASEVPFEGSTWAMPMQFEKTTDGGSCTPGCHKERAYNRSKPTTRPTNASPGGVS